jgi:hypothetical protein
MKNKKFFATLIFLILCNFSLFAQISDSTYFKRLYFTCKIWGQFKYQHYGIASGFVDWDEVLINHLDGIYAAPDDASFNDSILSMITDAEPIQSSFNELPDFIDSLYMNQEKDWMNDPFLSEIVQTQLDSLVSKFRPQYNYYLNDNIGLNNNIFDNDTSYFAGNTYPNKNVQLLALFRFWNIVHFCYPFKNIMDQHWDETLKEFIIRVMAIDNELDYHLTFKMLVSKLNDAQAIVSSSVLSDWDGNFHAPFFVRYIEDKMVITEVMSNISSISPGDVILEIDGLNIENIRDSLFPLASGSNVEGVEKSINDLILWGEEGLFEMLVFNGNEEVLVTLQRNEANYEALLLDNSPTWSDTIIENGCHYGIVDMGRLKPENVEQMYLELKELDGIIFDVRNPSSDVISGIISRLFDSPIDLAKIMVPELTYPGQFSWGSNSLGNWFSQTYSGKVIVLFDERTHNKGEYACMALDKHSNSIKIGSTTSGSLGSMLNIYLPGNIIANIILTGTFYSNYTSVQRIGIIPDYFIEPTIEGIRNGEDEVMAFALDCNLQDVQKLKLTNELNFHYFPNPAQDILYFESYDQDKISVEIFDLKGISLIQLEAQQQKTTIDISSLPAGVYLIKTTHNNAINVQRFIKE